MSIVDEIPNGWHVSWMGYDNGKFLCQITRHDVDENTPENEITFISRTSLRSCAEAIACAIAEIKTPPTERAE